MANSDDYLKQYLDRLVEKLGMGGIEPAKLEKLKDSLSQRLETKILLELVATLPEEEAKKIREKTESAREGEQEKILADFIQEKVKSDPEKIKAVLQDFERQVLEEKNLILKKKPEEDQPENQPQPSDEKAQETTPSPPPAGSSPSGDSEYYSS